MATPPPSTPNDTGIQLAADIAIAFFKALRSGGIPEAIAAEWARTMIAVIFAQKVGNS
jgi:hypothetical protein